MDKNGNVRRGKSVFSNMKKRRHITNKQSRRHNHRHKLLFGVFSRGDLHKSKKEKLRSLSAVGIVSSSSFQMGCNVSEEQTHEPSSNVIATTKRFKVHINFLNDGNGTSVPRKLRSATKKRGRESMSLDSEKVKHRMDGIESLKKDSVKKSKKQGMRCDWSKRERVSGPITKDEEEVAETLYALAGMFSDNGSNHNSKELEGESLPDNSSVLQDIEDNASAALEDSIVALATAQGASPCCHVSSAGEASKISYLNEAVCQEQPDLPESATLFIPSHSTSLTINLQTMPVVVKRENCNNKVTVQDSELCLAMGLNMSRQSQVSQFERKPDVESEAARDVDCKQQQHMMKEQKGNEGLALWPGLSPVAPAGQAYLQSSATNVPDWLDAAFCASKLDLMETSTCSSSGKNFIPERSWKRCAAHVHISHIIKKLELSKRQVIKEAELYEGHQMRAHEGSKGEVLLDIHSLNRMKNGITSTVRNPHESKNIILQQQHHYQDISKAAPTPVVYGPQKQNFNLLSLSAGSNGLNVDNNYNKTGSRLEPLSKFQVPYLQSLAQQHRVMPIPAAQSQYGTTSYLDQLSVGGTQVRLQQPHYFVGNQLYGTNYSSTVTHKQEHQSFWGVQQTEQSRSKVNFNIMRTQYPYWQSGRHDSSALNPRAQAIVPCSPASQEIFGSKITTISEKQKQLLAIFQDKWTRPSSPFCM